MPLLICTDIVGSETVLRGAPATICLPETIYIPEGIPGLPWGVYDHGGRVVGLAGSFRGPGHQAQYASFSISLRHDQIANRAPSDKYIYCGPFHGHYGHFLLSTLSRLWFCLGDDYKDAKFLCHPLGNLESHFNQPFIRDILDACGLQADQFVSFDQPTLIDQLIIPGPAFEETGFCYSVFAQLCQKIAVEVTSKLPVTLNDKPIYLSKSRLASGVGRLVNEDEFSQYLERSGFDICHPEQLDFSEQVSLFRSRTQITALTGSSLHTNLFGTGPSIVGLSYVNTLYTSYSMVDILAKSRSIYVYPSNDIELLAKSQHFHLDYRLTDVSRTAQQFLRLCDRERSDGSIGNIALNRPTKQSSYVAIEGLAVRDERVRNATNGRLTGRYQFHTHHEPQPWWEVDLGRAHSITSVTLHNRSDNSQSRAERFVIKFALVADEFHHTIVQDKPVVFGNGLEQQELCIQVEPCMLARYIRIELPGKEFLHLDQVEVDGIPCNSPTLAGKNENDTLPNTDFSE